MTPAVPSNSGGDFTLPSPVLQAPPHWRQVDFVSDLHLQASEMATYSAWKRYMQTTQADAVFILGDLFEVWIGDDVVTYGSDGSAVLTSTSHGFEGECAQVIKNASRRMSIFFMHGNRDFLLGPAFAKACGMTVLTDPTVLVFSAQRWLLSHGDALCLDDTDYMRFRSQVRSAQWQEDFLGKPLTERQAIARELRNQSDMRKRTDAVYADLDEAATCQWLDKADASTLIHGHTHKPAEHVLKNGPNKGLRRIVLSDWDASATPPRLEVLRLSRRLNDEDSAIKIQRLAPHLVG